MRVILVGNAPIELQNFGKLIDKFDKVIRFNNFSLKGFEEHIGSKTNIWCFNANSYIESPWGKLNNNDINIVHMQNNYYETAWAIALTHSKDTKFLKNIKNMYIVPYANVIKVSELCEIEDNYKPSIGLIAIYTCLSMFSNVYITGFNCFDQSKKHHYYTEYKWKPILHSSKHEFIGLSKLMKLGVKKLGKTFV